MHDPMTVAFQIRSIFSRPLDPSRPHLGRYRNSLVTIWHVDPEKNGSDDSCGWSFPRLTKKQREQMKALAFHEARDPIYMQASMKRLPSAREAESLMRAAILMVARVLKVPMPWDRACIMAARLANEPGDNFRSGLCFLPGYHSNFTEDTPDHREVAATSFFCSVASNILRDRRPWWKHPRYHFWHWKIQIAFTQNLKRWLFSRCSFCGKSFKWGEAPHSGQWDSDGPRWFKGEEDAFHYECYKKHSETPAVSG